VSHRASLLLYVAVGMVYVTLGVFVPEALFSWLEGAAFLLLGVWILPALVRRLRR
jgi:putative Ca2+/H+ antiporter (TMEM165/GDT1 family)